MTQISANLGDFSRVISRTLDAPGTDTNQTGLAAMLGWPEETLRNFVNGKSSPRFDQLCQARRRMPLALLIDLLQTLAGARAVVTAAGDVDVPADAKPTQILDEAVGTMRKLADFVAEVRRRSADGVICPDDAANLATSGAEVTAAVGRAVLMAQRCAASPAGRRN